MLREGQVYLFRGKVTGTLLRREMLSPEFLPEAKELRIQPVYPATAGLSSRQIGAAVQHALTPAAGAHPRPPAGQAAGEVSPVHPALRLETIHFPKNQEEITAARFRLTFEEFLVLQLGLLRIKSGRKQENLHPVPGEFPEGLPGCCPSS